MYKVLTQAWRILRLFVLTFAAQLAAQGVSVNKISQQAAIAAGVAAAEAVYRQFIVPDSKNGTLARLIVAYKQISTIASSPIVKATESQAVAEAKAADPSNVIIPASPTLPAPVVVVSPPQQYTAPPAQ